MGMEQEGIDSIQQVKKSYRRKVYATGINKGGRPSIYNEALAESFCALVAQGYSVRSICLRDDMPHQDTIFSWLGKHKPFSEQYARAKSISAEAHADTILQLAYDVMAGKLDPNGARVALDAFKWQASKLMPNKYGDKLDVTTEGKALPTPILGILQPPERKQVDNDSDEVTGVIDSTDHKRLDP